jgi:hypothetical protein
MYLEGRAIEKDENEAITWFVKSIGSWILVNVTSKAYTFTMTGTIKSRYVT